MSNRTRRQFLEDSMFAAAAAVVAAPAAAAFADEDKPSKSPNEKLGVAVVGCGGRGGSHLSAFAGRPDTEVLYVVDVDENAAKRRARFVADKQGREPKTVDDMREAFQDASVDVVSTATPNHWHSLVSIWAIQAGKDVYVEKPVSHNVSEGRRVVEAARKYNKICQTGTQCRSNSGMQDAMQYAHDGKLGKINVARGLCYKRRPTIGPRGEYTVPAGVNYNLWLGPAPTAPLTRPHFHYDWHWQWPYGNGDLGNQGIHQMDLCRWALGVDRLSDWVLSYGGRVGYEDAGDTANTQMIIHGYGDQALVFEVRGLVTDSYKGANVGIILEGSDGYLVMTDYDKGAAFDKDGQKVQEFKGGGDHFAQLPQGRPQPQARGPERRYRRGASLQRLVPPGQHLLSPGRVAFHPANRRAVAGSAIGRARGVELRAVQGAPGPQQARPGNAEARLRREPGARHGQRNLHRQRRGQCHADPRISEPVCRAAGRTGVRPHSKAQG